MHILADTSLSPTFTYLCTQQAEKKVVLLAPLWTIPKVIIWLCILLASGLLYMWKDRHTLDA